VPPRMPGDASSLGLLLGMSPALFSLVSPLISRGELTQSPHSVLIPSPGRVSFKNSLHPSCAVMSSHWALFCQHG
jgi:hypothetical protein